MTTKKQSRRRSQPSAAHAIPVRRQWSPGRPRPGDDIRLPNESFPARLEICRALLDGRPEGLSLHNAFYFVSVTCSRASLYVPNFLATGLSVG